MSEQKQYNFGDPNEQGWTTGWDTPSDDSQAPGVQPWREKAIMKLLLALVVAMFVIVEFTTAGMRSHAPKLEGYNIVEQAASVEYRYMDCRDMSRLTVQQRTIMAGDYLRLAWHNIEGTGSRVATSAESTQFLNAMVGACNTLAESHGSGYLSLIWVNMAASYAYYNTPVKP